MPRPHERLDRAMNERRLQLRPRLNWRQVAEAANISYTALRAIRRGAYRPAELTALALDEALQWGHGSVYALLDGGEPMPLSLEEGDAAEDPRVEGAPDDPRVQLVVDILDGLPPAVEREVMRRRGGRIVVPPEENSRRELGGEHHAQ